MGNLADSPEMSEGNPEDFVGSPEELVGNPEEPGDNPEEPEEDIHILEVPADNLAGVEVSEFAGHKRVATAAPLEVCYSDEGRKDTAQAGTPGMAPGPAEMRHAAIEFLEEVVEIGDKRRLVPRWGQQILPLLGADFRRTSSRISWTGQHPEYRKSPR